MYLNIQKTCHLKVFLKKVCEVEFECHAFSVEHQNQIISEYVEWC